MCIKVHISEKKKKPDGQYLQNFNNDRKDLLK